VGLLTTLCAGLITEEGDDFSVLTGGRVPCFPVGFKAGVCGRLLNGDKEETFLSRN
jgi:hypothetical protein